MIGAYDDPAVQRAIRETTAQKISDDRAMLLIAGALSGVEWSPDTLDAIADIVRLTGRDVLDSEPVE